MKLHGKRWFGILLTIALMLGLMAGMRLTAYADDTPPMQASRCLSCQLPAAVVQ